MSSSKVWRAGRWFWHCNTENTAHHWKDHWACGAKSKLTYSTQWEAWRAGYRHRDRTGHSVGVTQIRPQGRKKRSK